MSAHYHEQEIQKQKEEDRKAFWWKVVKHRLLRLRKVMLMNRDDSMSESKIQRILKVEHTHPRNIAQSLEIRINFFLDYDLVKILDDVSAGRYSTNNRV